MLKFLLLVFDTNLHRVKHKRFSNDEICIKLLIISSYKIERQKVKKNANDTRCSQAVTHLSTNRAQWCLTSVIGRELVYSSWYGRCRKNMLKKVTKWINKKKLQYDAYRWRYKLSTWKSNTTDENWTQHKFLSKDTNSIQSLICNFDDLITTKKIFINKKMCRSWGWVICHHFHN